MTEQQVELFTAETSWFHVFRDMIDSGDLARLEGSAIKVYLVVKSYTNFSTGRSFPAIELIAEKSGLSDRQVIRCLAELEASGYINKEKAGRHNLYTLREKVSLKDQHGKPQAVATWDYLPSGVKEAVAELRRVLVTGDLNGATILNIEKMTLNLNIVQGDNNTQLNMNGQSMSSVPAEIRKALKKLSTEGKLSTDFQK